MLIDRLKYNSSFAIIWLVMILLSLTTCKTAYSQNYQVTNINTEQGLPSNECFDIVQDYKGFIWIASDKGISRYDGKTFKNYGVEVGLKTPVVFRLLPFKNGAIAFRSADDKIGFLMNDSVHFLTLPTNCRTVDIYSYKEELYVSLGVSSYLKYSDKGELLERKDYPEGFYIMKVDSQFAFSFGRSLTLPDGITLLNEQGTKIKFSHRFKNGYEQVSTSICDDKIVFVRGQRMLVIEHDSIIKDTLLKTRVTISGCFDNVGCFQIGFKRRGMSVFSKYDFNEERSYLNGLTVTKIIEDRVGKLWVSTIENGIFKLSKSNLNTLFQDNVTHIKVHNDTLLGSTLDSHLVYFNLKENTRQIHETRVLVKDFLKRKNRLWVEYYHPPLGSLAPFEGFHITKHANLNGFSYALNFDSLVKLKDNKSNWLSTVKLPEFMGHVYTMETINNQIFMGSAGGFYSFKPDRIQPFYRHLKKPVTVFIPLHTGFVFGTKGFGVFIVNKEFEPTQVLKSGNQLSGNFIDDLILRNDTLYVATNFGLDILKLDSSGLFEPISHLQKGDGLLSENITGIELSANTLFVSSDRGLQSISIDELPMSNSIPTPTFLSVNGESILESVVTVAANKNGVSIELGTIYFEEAIKVERFYRIVELDDNWRRIRSDFIELGSLLPGEYHLQYKARVIGSPNAIIKELKVIIKPAYYQTTWFKLLVASLILILVVLLVGLRELRLKKEGKMLLEQEKLRYQALTTQLDPHFVSNALGSLQHLIVTDRNDEASEYLAKFSSLINKTLKNTNTMFISWKEEMDFINKYVAIERVRFEKSFHFSWKIAHDVDLNDAVVPTMLLQPFIENSILHGLLTKGDEGKIEVRVQVIGKNKQKIEILDNGIGLTTAKLNKAKRARQSISMHNIKERLSLISHMYKNSYDYNIEEITNDEEIVLGTRVTLVLPLKLNANA